MSRRRMFYIVRLRKDDSIVAVGRAEECAERMGLSLTAFRTAASRSRSGKCKKYEIDMEPEENEPC